MRRNRNYIIPAFFLFLTIAPVLFMGGLQVFQFYIKQRMEASLEREALTTIRVPVADVLWYEKGREVMIQGKMFDIKNYTIQDDWFTAQGIYDEDETEVVKLMNGHWSEDQQTHTIIQLLLISHCLVLMTFCFYTFNLEAVTYKPKSVFSIQYLSPSLSILIPPPKTLLFCRYYF